MGLFDFFFAWDDDDVYFPRRRVWCVWMCLRAIVEYIRGVKILERNNAFYTPRKTTFAARAPSRTTGEKTPLSPSESVPIMPMGKTHASHASLSREGTFFTT
mmetsp:Transcript_20219/g.42344  ORF Transcript_20219/g.42344 Transcript_20219/m.42344 type:complete len:102 (-) Transcript_20219:62-367(-)